MLYLEWRLVIGAIFYAYSISFFTASEISKKQSRGKYEQDSCFVFQTRRFRIRANLQYQSITSGVFRGRPTGRFLHLPDSTGRADLLVLQLVTVPAWRGNLLVLQLVTVPAWRGDLLVLQLVTVPAGRADLLVPQLVTVPARRGIYWYCSW